jgi:RNA polymerase sigma-70 factor, ECF subfamily
LIAKHFPNRETAVSVRLDLNKIHLQAVYGTGVDAMKLTDENSAIERCRKGDREAFAYIVQKYMKPAYYVALGYVGNPEDALDLSQDAFVNAFRHIRRFDPSRSFFPWFYSILKNVCMNHLSRIRRRREQPLEPFFDSEDEDPAEISIPVETVNPEQNAVSRNMAEKIGRAMRRLRPKEREIIILQHLQNFSYQEIADLLGIPIGTVMSRLYSARRSLRRELERMGVSC